MSECYEGNRNENNLNNFLEWLMWEDVKYARFVIDEDTDEEVRGPIKLDTRWMICECCRGEGSHALHGMAIDSDTWNFSWDYEEREAYLSGGYDTPCGECNGNGKVREVDWDYVDPDIKKHWEEWEHDRWQMDMEMAAERRMGA